MKFEYDTHFNKIELQNILKENLKKYRYNKWEDSNTHQECFDYMLESWFRILSDELKDKSKLNELKNIFDDMYKLHHCYQSKKNDMFDTYFLCYYKLSNMIKSDSLVGKIYIDKDDRYLVIINQYEDSFEYYCLSYDENGNFKESGMTGSLNKKSLEEYKLYGNYYNLMNDEKLRRQIGLQIKKKSIEYQLKRIEEQLNNN